MNGLGKTVGLFWVRVYQLLVSPALHLLAGPGMGCRFNPTCSQFAHEAISKHGLFRGGLLSLRRLSKCHPFSKHAMN